jgi:hypothetical protein
MTNHPPDADHHEGRLARLAHRLAEEDPSPTLPRGARVVMTAGPFAGFAAVLVVVAIVWGHEFAAWLLGAGVGSFVGFGKFVIFGGIFSDLLASLLGTVPQGEPPSPNVLAGVVIYAEIGTALVMMANMTLLYRTPWVGARLAAAHEAGWYVLRVHPWMRRMAELGVALFVAAPFQGTGAVVGTILGRVLGLSRVATLGCIAAGSAAGCIALAALGDVGRSRVEWLAKHPLPTVIALAVAVVVLLLVGRWFTGEAARAREGGRH